MSNINAVENLLKRLGAICDSGFALAIHIRFARPSLLYQTYSQKWNDYYSENGLMLFDPVVRWGLSETGLIRWDDITLSDEHKVMASARKFGLSNGLTYALGPASSRTISGLTKTGAPFTPDQVTEMCAIIDEIHARTDGDVLAPNSPELARLRAIQLTIAG